DPETASCLLLLDNVSDAELISAGQLADLPEESWLHVVATSRLGRSDLHDAGSRSAVAMVEIGSLATEDALELIRDHQPARASARLQPGFDNTTEENAAREIAVLLDGYTLAVEQAAVYLGSTGTPPTDLLTMLRSHGTSVLDLVGVDDDRKQMFHSQKLTG